VTVAVFLPDMVIPRVMVFVFDAPMSPRRPSEAHRLVGPKAMNGTVMPHHHLLADRCAANGGAAQPHEQKLFERLSLACSGAGGRDQMQGMKRLKIGKPLAVSKC